MAYDKSVVRTIISVGSKMGMTPEQIIAGLAGGLVESGLRNLNYGDRDSLGVFQQRPSMGWGSPSQVRDVDYAARKFFTELKKNWKNGRSAGLNVQATQRSAFPDRYDQRMKEAKRIFRTFAGEIGQDGGGQGQQAQGQISNPFGDMDLLASAYLQEDTPELADPYEDDFDDGEMEETWGEAVQVMGDTVRGQFDPNGDLFDEGDEGEDEFEVQSADGYDRMLTGNAGLMAAANPLADFDLDDEPELGATSITDTLGAANAQAREQQDAVLAGLAQSRERALDMLGAMAKRQGGPLPNGGAGMPRIRGFGNSKSIPGGLVSNASRAARVVRNMGFGGTIGGLGGRGYTSDHPHGGAIDVMTGLSAHGQKSGWQIANYFHANRGKLGVKYIIFNGKIASAIDNWRWRNYGGTPDGNRNPTAMHDDHVHISVRY